MVTKTCFLVEDDDDDQEIFSLALWDLDPTIECTIASSGLEALTLLADLGRRIPDVIFLDLKMPRMCGKQFLVELRKLTHLATVPVIIYTTSREQHDIDETRSLGAKGFVTKPSYVADLTRMLSRYFA